MKKSLISLALSALALLASLAAFAGGAEVRVGSFNILTASRFRDTDRSWDARRDSVVETMRSLDFDIVGLQEVRADMREFLASRFPDYEIAGECVKPGSERFCFVPVVYRRSRFDCERSGTFWLSETPDKKGSKSWDSSEPRICSYAVLRDRQSGRRLVFANTHLDHRGSEARIRGAQLIVERLAALDVPVVLVGDHNSSEIEGAASAFLSRLANALYLSETPPAGSWRTFNNFTRRDVEVSTVEALTMSAAARNDYGGSMDGNGRKAKGAFLERCGGNRIDFIYVTPGTRVLDYLTDNRPLGKVYPSDHFPIVATIEIPDAAQIAAATSRTAPLRIAYNYCTLAYTAADWGEREWDAEIDRLAKRGYNAALVTAGLPRVWQLVLRDFGMSNDAIRAFIPDEWAQPWWSMGNLEGEGAPLDDATIERDAALARHIVKRMAARGIRPILQGFTGLVPSSAPSLARFSGAQFIPQGKWAGYVRPTLLLPTDPAFAPAAAVWYRRLREVYGVTEVPFLAGDLFHEGGSTKGADVPKCVAAVQSAQQSNCPGTIWLVQSWRQNPTPDVCAGLDPRFTIVEGLCGDMAHGSERDTGYGLLPWVWCEVGNFGGNHGLYGNLRTYARMGRAARGLAARQFRGWGALSEGYFTNPVCQDLFDEMMMRPVGDEMSDAELDAWLVAWAAKRYGRYADPRLDRAWRLLRDGIYNCPRAQHGAVKNPMTLNPSWDLGEAYRDVAAFQDLRSDFYWNPAEVESAARCFVEVAAEIAAAHPSTRNDPALAALAFDLANVWRQVLSDRAATLVPQLRDDEGARQRFLALIDAEDRLLACVGAFRLDTYEARARLKAGERGARAFRRMITTWRNPARRERNLNDYACREYSGLLGGYYRARWEAFFNGGDIRAIEQRFVNDGAPTPPLPRDDFAALVTAAQSCVAR